GRTGSLEQALKNIMLIKKYNIPLNIKTIITNINFRDWVEIRQFCENNGFSYNIDHDVFAKKDGGNEPLDLRMTSEQYRLELEELDRLRGFTVKSHDENEFVCSGVRNSLFIDNSGKVYPCNKFLFLLGDLNKDNISNIWNKSIELHRIQNMRWKDLPECSKCSNNKYCIHCPGTSMLENGSEYAKSTLACHKAEIRKELYC
ncbi:MAG: SPASM domain-containing protein, partial [Lachnospiraceae bacterium]|nr:SPASM domain-containing protein [Lachnospiraceae bacterium]